MSLQIFSPLQGHSKVRRGFGGCFGEIHVPSSSYRVGISIVGHVRWFSLIQTTMLWEKPPFCSRSNWLVISHQVKPRIILTYVWNRNTCRKWHRKICCCIGLVFSGVLSRFGAFENSVRDGSMSLYLSSLSKTVERFVQSLGPPPEWRTRQSPSGGIWILDKVMLVVPSSGYNIIIFLFWGPTHLELWLSYHPKVFVFVRDDSFLWNFASVLVETVRNVVAS